MTFSEKLFTVLPIDIDSRKKKQLNVCFIEK